MTGQDKPQPDHPDGQDNSRWTDQTQTSISPPDRHLFNGRVESNRVICREHYCLRIRILGPFPRTRPGQFVQLGCREPDPGRSDESLGVEHEWVPGGELPLRQTELCGKTALLRRPFSLAGRGDDGRGAWIDIIHRVVGVGTDWLAGLQPGDAIDLIGPLGNHFPIPEDRSLALLVGGGVGLPPMFYLAEALHHAGHDAVGFIGAQMDDLLAVTRTNDCPPDPDGTPKPTVEEFSRFGYPTVITTDDGSAGLGGRITDGLTRYLDSQPTEDASRTIIYTCGPDPMMHAVAQVASRFGLECQVCLEQAMACGMGTCQSCVVRIEDHDHPHARTEDGKPWRYRLTCTDGPVFEAKKVLWG